MTDAQVPFVDLRYRVGRFRDRIHDALDTIISSGIYILGNSVETFENQFADFNQSQTVVAVGNGTDAIQLTLCGLNLPPNSEVITTPLSFLASTSAIALAGHQPIFADVGADLNLDPASVESLVTKATKAIVVVHLGGIPANMECLKEIAERHNLSLIEDCAQAIGALWNSKPVGTFGTAGAFSFHPLKNLGALGDGGAIITSNAELAAWLKRARNHGLVSRDDCEFWGQNSRLDALQAAFLSIFMEDLPGFLEGRRVQAMSYRHALSNCVRFPYIDEKATASYNNFVILTERRDELQTHLDRLGIETKIHYPIPIHRLMAAELTQSSGYQCHLPNADKYTNEMLSLPMGNHLSDEQIGFVIESIHKFFSKYNPR
jgi:dTDP-4-amino-4,6-dideoxygalactose transaminase